MRCFEPVWRLYAKGLVREQEPERRERIKLPTQQWESITTAIDTVALYDPQEIYELSHIQDLPAVMQELQEAEKAAAIILSKAPADNTIYGHLLRVARAGETIDSFLKSNYEKTYSLFEQQIKEYEQDLTVHELQRLRKQSNDNANILSFLQDYTQKRGIRLAKTKKETVKTYTQKAKKIEEINEEISSLQKNYIALDFDKEGLKDLQRIIGRIRKPFNRGRLLRTCDALGFREAKSKLEELFDEAVHMQRHAGTYRKRKELYLQAIEELKKIGRQDVDQEKIHEAITHYNYDISTDKKTIYLGKLASEYKQAFNAARSLLKPVQQSPQKMKVVHVDVKKQKKRSFSLSAYLFDLGEPQEQSLTRLVDCLGDVTGAQAWDERFSQYSVMLEDISFSSRQQRDYISQIAQGIKQAILLPEADFDVRSAQAAYDKTREMLGCYAA